MSSYITFYVRKNDTFCPIGTFTTDSRSDKRYELFRYHIPYGKCMPITKDTLSLVKDDATNEESFLKEEINRLKKLKETVSLCNATLDEKVSAFSDIIFEMGQREDELKELSMFVHFVYFLSNILEETVYRDLDEERYIYAGVEAPDPTPENVLD